MDELTKMFGENTLAIISTAILIGAIVFTIYGDGPLHNLIINVVNAAS